MHTPVRNFAASGKHLPGKHFRYRGHRCIQPTYRESLFKAYTTINRFRTLIEEDELTVQSETFRRLLVKVLSTTNIPFHGEPAIGMQVMGVLETRNLDFRHLVLLSVNEGSFPNREETLPYSLHLRKLRNDYYRA